MYKQEYITPNKERYVNSHTWLFALTSPDGDGDPGTFPTFVTFPIAFLAASLPSGGSKPSGPTDTTLKCAFYKSKGK